MKREFSRGDRVIYSSGGKDQWSGRILKCPGSMSNLYYCAAEYMLAGQRPLPDYTHRVFIPEKNLRRASPLIELAYAAK